MSGRKLTMGYPSARELVMTYGWNTTAYQILNPGLQHWYARDVPAVVAYLQRSDVMLVAGAPVCAAEALESVVKDFERFAAAAGRRVCYVCAADRMRELVANSRQHSTIVIGAQPVWNPQAWAGVIEVAAIAARATRPGAQSWRDGCHDPVCGKGAPIPKSIACCASGCDRADCRRCISWSSRARWMATWRIAF
jgi:hypothetical protein